jgi:(p)ppGpp synthase/HD superfamily hydrolase
VNQVKLAHAIDFASRAHAGQTRKYTGEPYVSHCIDVLKLLQQRVPDASEEMLVAAVLHDVLEDTDVSYYMIEQEFGGVVAELVYELTSKEDKSKRRAERKEGEAQRLAAVSPEAQTIKYADIICNLRDIGEHDPNFAPKYRAEKRRILMLAGKGYESLRQEAWLMALEPGPPYGERFIMSYAEAEKMVGG